MEHEVSGVPVGHFITFRTYGTWLHGDRRGSVDRRQNTPGEPTIEPNLTWFDWSRSQMSQTEMILSDSQREVCDDAMQALAKRRGWRLLALNVRTNHVHVVVFARGDADRIMNDFKAAATRALRKGHLIEHDRVVWARHGSTRRLSTNEAIERACLYVIEAQGRRLGTIGDGWS